MQHRASLQSPDPHLSSPVHLDDDGCTQKDFTHSEPTWEMTFLKTSFSPAGSLLRPPAISVMDLPLCLATPFPSPLLPGPPTPTLNKPPTPKPLSQAPPLGNLRLWDCHKTVLMGSGPAPDKGGMWPQGLRAAEGGSSNHQRELCLPLSLPPNLPVPTCPSGRLDSRISLDL